MEGMETGKQLEVSIGKKKAWRTVCQLKCKKKASTNVSSKVSEKRKLWKEWKQENK